MRHAFHRFFFFLQDAFENRSSDLGRKVEKISFSLVVLSSLVLALETTSFAQEWNYFLRQVNFFLLWIFSLEYFLRFFAHRNRLRFLFSFYSLVDLIVIFSFFFLFLELPFLRLFRLFLVFRFVEHSRTFRVFFRNFRHYLTELRLFAATYAMVLFVSSFAMYFAEHHVNERINTIFDALWLAVVTIFTIGYGDTIPVTHLGRFIAGIIAFLGIANVAMLTALITKVFMDHFFGKREKACHVCRYPHHDFDAKFCKNCGSELEEEIRGF